MIRYLAIRNLAVIESVAVDFEHSFNILTGETGAGKSILVEAVGLLLGGRASADLVRTGEDLATVEAIFELPGGGSTEESELVVRSSHSAQGNPHTVEEVRRILRLHAGLKTSTVPPKAR